MGNVADRHFVIRLRRRPRGNQADVLVDGRPENSGSWEPNAGELIRAFRFVVSELRQKYPGATFDLPGGLRNETDLITESFAQKLIEGEPKRRPRSVAEMFSDDERGKRHR